MLDTKRIRFSLDIILICIRWYAAYSLSYRNLEEMMHELGVFVDHSSTRRGAIMFLPLLGKYFAYTNAKLAPTGGWRRRISR